MKNYLYRVPYRIDLSSRVAYMTVVAATTDEARAKVKAADPRYLSTVRSPRRGAVVPTGEYA